MEMHTMVMIIKIQQCQDVSSPHFDLWGKPNPILSPNKVPYKY